MVNIRLAAIGKRPTLEIPARSASRRAEARRATAARSISATPSAGRRCPVYERETLGAGATIAGPAMVQEHGTTTVLFAGDACTVAPIGRTHHRRSEAALT